MQYPHGEKQVWLLWYATSRVCILSNNFSIFNRIFLSTLSVPDFSPYSFGNFRWAALETSTTTFSHLSEVRVLQPRFKTDTAARQCHGTSESNNL